MHCIIKSVQESRLSPATVLVSGNKSRSKSLLRGFQWKRKTWRQREDTTNVPQTTAPQSKTSQIPPAKWSSELRCNVSLSWQLRAARVKLIYIIINTQVKTTHMLTLTADYWGGKRHWQCNWFISQLHPAHQSFTASRTTTTPEKKRGPSNVRLSRTRSYFPLRRLRHMRHSL